MSKSSRRRHRQKSGGGGGRNRGANPGRPAEPSARRSIVREQTYLTTAPADERVPAGMHRWPVVRAYVPDRDVFRATGHGLAGVVRRQPDGKVAAAYFQIGLNAGGLENMFGKYDSDPDEEQDFIRDMAPLVPSYRDGPADLASRYIYGAYAWGLAEGFEWPPAESKKFMGLVPPMSGTRRWWFQQFADGDDALVPAALADVLRENPAPDDLPEGKEVLIFTTAEFELADGAAAARELERLDPEFELTDDPDEDTEEDTSADDAPADESGWKFVFTREHPKKHWNPFRLFVGGRRSRQIIGDVTIRPRGLVAETKSLSMGARLIGRLKDVLGDALRLRSATWQNPLKRTRHAATFGSP